MFTAVVVVDGNAGARGVSSEALELHVEGGRVRPLYGHGLVSFHQ